MSEEVLYKITIALKINIYEGGFKTEQIKDLLNQARVSYEYFFHLSTYLGHFLSCNLIIPLSPFSIVT